MSPHRHRLVLLSRRPEHDLVPGWYRCAPGPAASRLLGRNGGRLRPIVSARGGGRRGGGIWPSRSVGWDAGTFRHGVRIGRDGLPPGRTRAGQPGSAPAVILAACVGVLKMLPGSDRRHRRAGPLALGEHDRGPLILREAEADGLVVVGDNVPLARVVDPLSGAGPAADGEPQLDLPVAVLELARVPLRSLGIDAGAMEPLRHDVAQLRSWPGVAVATDGGPLGFLRPVLPLSQDRTLKAANPVRRYAGRICDLVCRLASADAVLDLLGSQRILHFDLVLSEPGELTLGHRPQPVVYGQQETSATPRHGKDGVAAVLADCDEAQLLHRCPSCGCPAAQRRSTDLP